MAIALALLSRVQRETDLSLSTRTVPPAASAREGRRDLPFGRRDRRDARTPSRAWSAAPARCPARRGARAASGARSPTRAARSSSARPPAPRRRPRAALGLVAGARRAGPLGHGRVRVVGLDEALL